MTKFLTPGQRLTRLPAVSLNKAIEAGARMQEFSPPGGPAPTAPSGDSPRNVVLVKNMTGVDLIERSIVGIKETAFTLPDITGDPEGDIADQAVLIGEAVEVEKPDPAKHTAGKWGVTLGPIKDEETGWMAIGGLIKARVDVSDEGHGFARPIYDQTEHLESATSGTPITFKKTGTGKKWAQINLGAGGGASQPQLAILYDKLNPASITLDLEATTSAAVAITPGGHSSPETPCVIPLAFVDGAYQAQVWGADSEGTEGEPKKLPAENHCWETCIVGGDGEETETEGVYNEPPLLVEGFTFTKTTGEGEEAETKTYFAITDVITPAVMFVATADAAVTGADFDATASAGIHGKLPQGKKSIENELAWDIDSGGKVLVVRGLDGSGVKYWAFNAECPA